MSSKYRYGKRIPLWNVRFHRELNRKGLGKVFEVFKKGLLSDATPLNRARSVREKAKGKDYNSATNRG